ncbi:hypothetical protein [Helicobacter bilis]|nr:hypothetical protein [Helicobacter bilis]
MQKVIKRELIDTLQYMKIPHNRKFVDSRSSDCSTKESRASDGD